MGVHSKKVGVHAAIHTQCISQLASRGFTPLAKLAQEKMD